MSMRRNHDLGRRAFLTRAGGLAAALVTAKSTNAAEPQSRVSPSPRDLGLWFTWYDLPEQGRSEYLSWLHGTFIPGVLKHPGYLWAAHYTNVSRPPTTQEQTLTYTNDPAVGKGNAYFLVFGAEDSGVFGRPSPSELHRSLSAADRKMLAMRTGERINVFAEAARVTGPDVNAYKEGTTLAPCIQIGTFNVDFRKEEDVLAWYAQNRMPGTTTMKGCIRTRKLASVSGWAKEAILYEFSSVEIRNQYFPYFEDPYPDRKEWSNRVVKTLLHAPGSPNLGRRIWPPIAG